MKTSHWLVMILVLAFGDACVEPLNVPVVTSARKLVVDGLITNGSAPYRVRLFMSSYLDEDITQPRDVIGAVVKIVDELGNEQELFEEKPGEYWTDGSSTGQVGRKYQLQVLLTDGKSYESSWEEIQPAGEIANIYFEYRANSINADDLTKPQNAFFVYLDAIGVPGEKNLLRWRWTGTFHTVTYPQWRTKTNGIDIIPDPLPCSGFIAPDEVLEQVGPCICCDCWAPMYNRDVHLSANDFASAQNFNKVLIGKIPVERVYFYEKFHIGVEQLALSEEAYDFWKLVASSQQGADNIFQPNTVKVKGNMRCVTDESEEVYGVFSAASVVEDGVFIHRYDIPNGIMNPDTLTMDCRQLFPGSTNQKPPFW